MHGEQAEGQGPSLLLKWAFAVIIVSKQAEKNA